MVGQNRTPEFLEYVRIKTETSSNSTKHHDTIEDSIIITTSKQMRLSITKMHQRVSERQYQYLDLNRFLNPSSSIDTTSKHPHHTSTLHDVWTEEDRFQFENEILIFVKDITSQITKLTELLNSSELKTEHDYIKHQKNILQCLRFEVMSLSDKIRHLIKARSTALHMQHTHSSEDGLGLKKSIKQQDLEAFVDQMMKKEARGNENEHD
eukprot:379484_1